MKLNYDFEIASPLQHAWAVLLDVPRIAPCMPGAELTEIVSENVYKGAAKVKLGPVQLAFAGEAEILDIDQDKHSAVLKAKGADKKGRGTANAEVKFQLSEAGAGKTRVDLETDLVLSGSIAQYGRASGLIDQIAQQIIADFVKNLEAEMGEVSAVEEGKPHLDGPSTIDGEVRSTPGAEKKDNAISGFSFFFRVLWSMITGWFKPKKNGGAAR